jgi:hypothetical protein
MKNLSVWVLIVLFMGAGFFCACSDKNSGEKEKNVVERTSDDAAKKIADKILSPVDNAREAKDLGDKHMDELQHAMDE